MTGINKQDEIKKSIDNVVDQILNIEKSMPISLDANGGQDKICSGTPLQTEAELKAAKEDEAKKAKEKSDEESVAKAKEDKKEDDEDEDEEDDEKKNSKKDSKKDDKKLAFMKKSVEELASVLDEEELELIKAWREQPAEEEIAKSKTAESEISDKSEDLKKALADIVAPIQKAMSEKDDLIKSLGDKIEKMASQPAYDRRSISTLEALEKSGSQESQTISKKQVTDKMLELQIAGKGVTSHHIGEFEATGNISDAMVKSLVFKELKLN